MIKYLLKCKNKHEFESWFSESKEFEKLKKKKLMECIFCHSKDIEKSIMSPNIVGKENIKQKKFNKIKKNLIETRKFFEKNFQFVGDKFPKEVREIYYNKNKNKNIYGTVTSEEKLELEEEGIELANIPWLNKKEN
jgi:hypothetical protein